MLALIGARDPAVRRMLCRCLEKQGWITLPARDGPALAYLAPRLRPELILSDASLSGSPDGAAAARFIRGPWSSAPIVLMTGDCRRSALLRLEGWSVLEKPFTLAELMTAAQGQLPPAADRARP